MQVLRLVLTIAAASTSLYGRAASAQQSAQQPETCVETLTLGQCLATFSADPAARGTAQDQAAPATVRVTEQLAGKSTGGDVTLPNTGTAIHNFLPRLAAAVLAPGLTDDSTALGLRTNLPLNDGVLIDLGLTLQLEVIARRPALFPPLLDSIPEARRTATRERFERTLEDYDDASIALALNAENRRFGRGLRQHTDELSRLAGAILRPLDDEVTVRATEYIRLLGDLVPAQVLPERRTAAECTGTDALEFRLDCFTPTRRTAIVTAIAALAAASQRASSTAPRALESAGFYRLADLINNQPQLNTRVEYRTRRDVIGPNGVTAQVRLELGLANLNGLRSFCRRTSSMAAITPGCLRQYVTDRAVLGSLNRGDRFWLSVDLSHEPRYTLMLPEDTVNIALPGAWQIAPSIGYGTYFGQNTDGSDRGRFDLQLKYVLAERDTRRQDRAVGTVTLTQRLTDQATSLITVSYANKSEFLDTVDRKLRANLGLSYRLVQPKAQPNQ